MLMTVGRSLSAAPIAARAQTYKRFSFYQNLPDEVTFERNSIGIAMNNAGQLVEVSANQPRFNHDEYGNRLGLMLEPAVTNKCKNQNTNPVDTSGIIASGDANGVLSLVDDAAELANAGLGQLCTSGMVYKADNTLGTSSFTLYIDGKVANTNPHSLSAYVRSVSTSGRVCRFYIGGGTLDINANSQWQRYAFENETPTSTSRKFTIIVDPGKEIYFILNQLEEYPIATSVIAIHSAQVTRQADRAYIENINNYEWFNLSQGYLTCRYNLTELVNADSYIGVLHDGSTANTIGLRIDSSTHVLRGYMRADSSSQFTAANQEKHLPYICHVTGARWNSSETAILSGGSLNETLITALPNGINRLEIGARNGGSSPMHGHVQEIEIGSKNLSNNALGRKLQKSSDIIIASGGQSLMRGHFNSQESGSDAGKQTHKETIGEYLKEKAVVMIDGSTGSSAAVKSSDSVNYWWDLDTDTAGPAFSTFIQNIESSGTKPTMLLWAQGEQDSHYIGSTTTRENYKLGLETIFNEIRSLYGSIPVFIQRIGRRTSFSNNGGVQDVRDIQQELVDEYDWIFEASEVYDVGLYDHVHLDDAGYATVAERNALNILKQQGVITTGHQGPSINNASLSGSTISVALQHDAGDDFTPTSNIEGFRFFDGGSEITVLNAYRNNFETITLDLENAPTSPEQTLYYGYDFLDGVNRVNIVRDNSNLSMPLQTSKIDVN